MNDRQRDLRQTAGHVSRAIVELKWSARDLEAAGHTKQAAEMRRVGSEMEALNDQLYEWAGEIDSLPIVE